LVEQIPGHPFLTGRPWDEDWVPQPMARPPSLKSRLVIEKPQPVVSLPAPSVSMHLSESEFLEMF
jgi:hypothetical protein